MTSITDTIARLRLVPVVVLDKVSDAKPLAEALVAGGLPCMEITFRTAAAADSIRAVSNIPGLLIGAGTVLSIDNVNRAMDAGAKFIVSPGLNPRVVGYCVNRQIPVFPGVATPTEIEMAMDHGLAIAKFFPAEALGGVKMLKAISAPYGNVKFMPTGGITEANLADYLKLPSVIACGGSWMVAKELIATGDFGRISELTRAAVTAARA